MRLAAGEHVDILETPEGLEPRFRITLKSVVRMADAAHIAVAFGGTRVSCGPLVQEKSTNEFIVPRALRDEPRSSVVSLLRERQLAGLHAHQGAVARCGGGHGRIGRDAGVGALAEGGVRVG